MRHPFAFGTSGVRSRQPLTTLVMTEASMRACEPIPRTSCPHKWKTRHFCPAHWELGPSSLRYAQIVDARKRQSTTLDGALARNSQCENDTLLLVSPHPKCAHLTCQGLGACQCNKGFKALDAQRYMPLLKLRSWSLKLGLRGKLPIGEPWVILFLPLKLRRPTRKRDRIRVHWAFNIGL